MYYQTFDKLTTTFQDINFMVQQIENIIQIIESYQTSIKDDYNFSEKFNLYLELKPNNIVKRKDELNLIIEKYFNYLKCPIVYLPIYIQYLSKNNKIEKIRIYESYSSKEKSEHDYISEIEKSVNGFADIFQNVKRLKIDTKLLNSKEVNLNVLKQLQQLREIKINYNYDIENICENIQNVFEIFQNIKTFERIKIDFGTFLYFLKSDKKQKRENKQQKYNEEQQQESFQFMLEDVDRYFLIHNQQASSWQLKDQLISLNKKHSYLQFQSQILIFEQDNNQVFDLELKFKHYKFGELIIQYYLNDKNELILKSINCQNYQRLICLLMKSQIKQTEVEQIVKKWFKSQNDANQLQKVLEITSSCECDDYYQFGFMIYNGQKQLKSISLYIYQSKYCSSIAFENYCNKVGLSDGKYFVNLLEIKFVINTSMECLEKTLFKIININKTINTIKYNDKQCFNKINMLKLNRIVIIEQYHKYKPY